MKKFQIEAVRIAKELLYDEYVLEKLKNAKDENEIERIMYDARNEKGKRNESNCYRTSDQV